MRSASLPAAGSTQRQGRKAGIAAFIGTLLEWYDFLIYGTAAALILNELFFPTTTPIAGTLAAFATYAVGFLARPLGGLVLGTMGDRVGRKGMLVLTVVLMGLATTAIGLLPTYAQIGIWAPILLVILRLLQGFGAGGEYAGAVVLSVEHGDQQRRGLAGAWAPTGFAAATLMSTGVFQLFVQLPEDQFRSWGWRVPFLIGGILLLVAYLIRRHISETPAFEEAMAQEATGQQKPQKMPLLAALREHRRNFLVVIGARFAENGFAYLFPVFGVAYAANQLGLSRSLTLLSVVVASAVQMAAIPAFAALSDRIGRRPVYAGGAVASLLWLPVFFLMLETMSPTFVMIAFVVGLGIFYPAMLSPQAAYFAELFGTRTRLSGFAFAREIGSVLAGGFLPLIATALLAWAGHWWAVLVYLAFMTVITLVALALGPETRDADLSELDQAASDVVGMRSASEARA